MKIEELLFFAGKYIHKDHAKILLSELINVNPLELYNHLDDYIELEIAEKYKSSVKSLANGEPIQYVLGNVNFYGNKFYVNKNVLIPRFETEELVENTIKYAKEMFKEPVDIIDLGTGSGIIGLTLEKKLNTNSVDLIDISSKALEVTKINKENLTSKANLVLSDMFENVNKKYDIIISNPPYIKTVEEIEDIVKNNEPELALYAGIDGLDCYRKILKDVKKHMKQKCLIAFEIGMTQANDITNLIKENLENVSIVVKKDLSEKDRMIFIFTNNV